MADDDEGPPVRGLWTAEQVAAHLGWGSARTVHRATWASRGKIKNAQALTDLDFPLPATVVGRTPLWQPTRVRAYAHAHSVHQPLPPLCRTPVPIAVDQITTDDVVMSEPYRGQVVLDTLRRGNRVGLLLATRRRDPGVWRSFATGTLLSVRQRKIITRRKTS